MDALSGNTCRVWDSRSRRNICWRPEASGLTRSRSRVRGFRTSGPAESSYVALVSPAARERRACPPSRPWASNPREGRDNAFRSRSRCDRLSARLGALSQWPWNTSSTERWPSSLGRIWILRSGHAARRTYGPHTSATRVDSALQARIYTSSIVDDRPSDLLWSRELGTDEPVTADCPHTGGQHS